MRYTYVRQHDSTDCAAASLAMVCLHYKKEITITRLRDMMGTDLKGTNLTGMEKAAQELGFSTVAVRVDRENFLSEFTTPCIAQVITDEGLAHFVTVFKKTTIKDDGERRRHMLRQEEERKKCADEGKKFKCRDYVIIGDPAKELKKISLDEFYKNFTGVLLLMTPTSEFKAGKQKQGSMVKRFLDLLLPQKKLFFYAILSSVIMTVLGIASSMYNKILMDEILPYGLKSLLVAVILVFSIETAIWINLAIPYFRGRHVFYIAYLIISTIQLGATVDYAILFSDRYQEFRETLDKKQAIAATVSTVTTSVITTGSALAVVGFLMGAISTNQLLGQLGNFLGVGSLVSLAIVLSALPGFLYLADPLIIKKKRQPKEA